MELVDIQVQESADILVRVLADILAKVLADIQVKVDIRVAEFRELADIRARAESVDIAAVEFLDILALV